MVGEQGEESHVVILKNKEMRQNSISHQELIPANVKCQISYEDWQTTSVGELSVEIYALLDIFKHEANSRILPRAQLETYGPPAVAGIPVSALSQ